MVKHSVLFYEVLIEENIMKKYEKIEKNRDNKQYLNP